MWVGGWVGGWVSHNPGGQFDPPPHPSVSLSKGLVTTFGASRDPPPPQTKGAPKASVQCGRMSALHPSN